MQIDTQTLISYTAVFIALIGSVYAFFWSREERPGKLLWFCLPFLLGVLGGALTVNPALRPGDWGLRFGALAILLAHGFSWQASRVFYSRRPLPLLTLVPPLFWFLLSIAVFRNGDLSAVNASIRAGIMAAFNGLSAYEFWRSRERENLPACRILFWVFAAYCLLNIARIPLSPVLPLPLGSEPAEIWAIVVYNVASVLLALLVCVFMIVLSRERISAQHYRLALRDAMTNVYNRRAYFEHVQAYTKGGNGHSTPYAMLVFDIDRFKSINDRFGHQIGDKVIMLAARIAETTLRKHDKVFRMGGEEFVCLLPETTPGEAHEAAERVRQAFQNVAAVVDGKQTNATISIGVAATDGMLSVDRIFARADTALYAAKQTGRNRTVMAADYSKSSARAAGASPLNAA